MSHVTVVDIEILDLDCLRQACADLGLKFREGQTSFKWYGWHMGDFPLPEGFTKADMGICDHAIAVNGNKNAYEVGVVARRDGRPGYHLMWDFFAGGYGLQEAVGKGCSKLCQKYSEMVVNKHTLPLKARGWMAQKTINRRGEVVIHLRKA